MKISSFIKLLLVGVIALTAFCECIAQPKKKEIGLQLYSLRADIKSQGIEKVLSEVAQMGYTKLELAGYKKGLIYGKEPMEFKELAERYGLEITSSHVVRKISGDLAKDMTFWSTAIKHHADMGIEFLIMPILPLKHSYPFSKETPITQEDVEATCEYFTKIGKMANAEGIRFGFHNHAHELKINVDGKPVLDWMLEKLDPKYVFFQMDVYWVKVGGYDPVTYLTKYPGHFPSLHISDEHGVGSSGEMDFGAIFKAAYKQGMETYYVEVEEYIKTPMEEVRDSYDFLHDAKFVK